MAAPKKYGDELRERATRMAVELRRDAATRNGAIQRVGEQLGIHPESLRGWVKRAEVDEGVRPGTTSADAQRIVERTGEPRAQARERHPAHRLGFFRGSGARPQTEVIVAYIDEHRERVVEGRRLGVEPICQTLAQVDVQIAPSTYYASKTRPASARAARDAELVPLIAKAHEDNLGVYGTRKINAELNCTGTSVAKCTVERLMRAEGLRGISREKTRKTTHSDGAEPERPADLVERKFVARAPNHLWVADLTYVRTHSGWVYAAFILDVFSRMIVGWQVSTSLRTDLALDALDMGLWARKRAGQDVAGLTHHSDRGAQGGFNRWSQHLLRPEVFDDGDGGLEQEDPRCAGECASAVACGSGVAAADAFAWPA